MRRTVNQITVLNEQSLVLMGAKFQRQSNYASGNEERDLEKNSSKSFNLFKNFQYEINRVFAVGNNKIKFIRH